ncbi:ABC transporter substrate-binding protein [Salibacterium aidingense]|uniref:ABC transporter substrate-binding protein n=1 Tax=Salibacterium aidingense TaxID=384933 RepID=UPI003BEBE1E3
MGKKSLLYSLLIIPVLLVSACQQEEAAEDGETDGNEQEDALTLDVLHSFTGEQPQAPVIEPAFETFDEEHSDINLQIETAGGNDIEQVLRTQVSADDAPDVFTHWGMRRSESYFQNGDIPDISELIESDSELEGMFREGSYTPVTYQGGVFGLPILSYSYHFIVNTEMFEEYEVSVPTNYDELKEAVTTFQENGVIPFAANNHSARYMLLNLFSQHKTQEEMIEHATGEEPFGDALYTAAERVQELAELGAFPDGYMSMESAQAVQLLNAGQSPMYYQMDWTLGHLDENQMEKLDIIPFPLASDGLPQTTISGNGQFIYMSNEAYEDPDKREAAWELMKKIASPEIGRQIIEEASVLDLSNSEVEFDESNVNPILVEAYEDQQSAENIVPSYDEELFASEVENEYWPLVDSLLLGDITPQEFVDEMNNIIQEYPNVQFDE